MSAGPENDEIGAAFRKAMPVAERWTYLDHAAVAPLSGPAREALQQWADSATQQGDTAWPTWRQRLEQVRSRAASLLHASPREIAFVANTTSAVDLVAQAFPWRDGDNLVTVANEFPSNSLPWKNLESDGIEVRTVEAPRGVVDLQRIADRCDSRTRLLAISWVGYASGWRVDLDELSRLADQRGIAVFLDAIQGLGVFPLDLSQLAIDFVAADGHKWLLGPEGAGLLYIRESRLSELRIRAPGWNSLVDAFSFEPGARDLKRDASRYEGGSHNLGGLVALGASLDLLASLGLGPTASPLASRVLALADYAEQELRARGAVFGFERPTSHRSGILTFSWPGQSPRAIRQRCLARGIAVSVRGGGVRISPHAYNHPGEIDRLIEVLEEEGAGETR